MNNEISEKNANVVMTPNPTTKDTAATSLPNIPNKTLSQPLEGSLSEGFNLMPKMTVEQQAVETTKATFNIGSVLGFIAFVALTLFIVGFNILSLQQLNKAKEELSKSESTMNQKIDIIISNNAIVDRILLYEKIKKNSFSHKEVVDVFQAISVKTGNIELSTIEVTDSLTFTIEGNASSLEEVSKLWYLLGTNEDIEYVNLDSVGKGANGARFSFEGKLNSSKFFKS